MGITKPLTNLADTNICEDQAVYLVSTPYNYTQAELAIYNPQYAWLEDNVNLGVNNDSIYAENEAQYIGMITDAYSTTDTIIPG